MLVVGKLRLFFLWLATLLAGPLVADAQGTVKASYRVMVEAYDWGPCIGTLVVDLGQPVTPHGVSSSTFQVSVERRFYDGELVKDLDWATWTEHESKGVREVSRAYGSDRDGNPVVGNSRYLTLKMKTGPEEILGSPLYFDPNRFLNSFVTVNHTLVQRSALTRDDGQPLSKLTLTPADSTLVCRPLEKFHLEGVHRHTDRQFGEITLHYATFEPKSDGGKHPLIVWLHGAGEGGTDPAVVLLGNRVTRLAEDPLQGLMGGAYVLAPQSPTVWMDNGQRYYPADGTTRYVGALKALIDADVAANPAIDRNRIYLGGCSNGGYMTVKMVLEYPTFFAAAFPICEAYADRWISDAQIQSIKDLPIWFTQAQSDSTVKAAQGGYVMDTYRRLVAAGGKNIHLSSWDKVEDLSGQYFQAGGRPYEYPGHWSWIYTLNNACTKDFDGTLVQWNGRDTTIGEWLAGQSR